VTTEPEWAPGCNFIIGRDRIAAAAAADDEEEEEKEKEEEEKEKEKEEEVTFLQRKVSLLNPLGKAKVEPQDSLSRTWLL
jgi:hypothetical protein